MAPVIFDSISKAIDQLDDRRFRAVILRGVSLTLAALVALLGLVFWGTHTLIGDTLTLPWIGTITWAGAFASWGAVALGAALSVFLMVPIAQAVQSLFLDQVSDAVEARYYPHLPPAQPTALGDAVLDGLRAFGVLILANLLGLVLYVLFAPLAPFIFYGINGFLLGREYFQVTALRRLGPEGARQMRRKHAMTIWGAGIVMALPLTIPGLNLLIPVLGAASFTHLYHRLSALPEAG